MRNGKHTKLPTFTDLRDLEHHAKQVIEKEEQPEDTPYLHLVPPLPKWTNKTYRTQNEKQNLYNLTCTCSEYTAKAKRYDERDIRRLCIHLYYKLTETKAQQFIDDLTKLIMKAAVFHKEKRWLKHNWSGGIMVIGFADETDWVNVYLPTNEHCLRFAYNPVQRRFAHNASPPKQAELEHEITMLLGYATG